MGRRRACMSRRRRPCGPCPCGAARWGCPQKGSPWWRSPQTRWPPSRAGSLGGPAGGERGVVAGRGRSMPAAHRTVGRRLVACACPSMRARQHAMRHATPHLCLCRSPRRPCRGRFRRRRRCRPPRPPPAPAHRPLPCQTWLTLGRFRPQRCCCRPFDFRSFVQVRGHDRPGSEAQWGGQPAQAVQAAAVVSWAGQRRALGASAHLPAAACTFRDHRMHSETL